MMTITKKGQMNPHYDPAKSCNGGGYDQPFYEFELLGHPRWIADRDKGDFGEDWTIEYRGIQFSNDTVVNEYYPDLREWAILLNEATYPHFRNRYKICIADEDV